MGFESARGRLSESSTRPSGGPEDLQRRGAEPDPHPDDQRGCAAGNLERQGAFYGFQVTCDRTTTTPDDIQRGIVNILVAFAPVKPAEFIHPTRVAVSGRGVGPSLYHMLEVLGKGRTLARIQQTLARFVA